MILKKYTLFIISVFTVSAYISFFGRTDAKASQSKEPCQIFQERLNRLEPKAPVNIDDPPWSGETFPSKKYPVSEIIKKGTEIPLESVYNNSEWKRQAYKSYWHSTVSGGRWSYVPVRMHYAMHRLFTVYPTASIYYDFIHDLGIEKESSNFKQKHNEPFKYIKTVIMLAQVQKILAYGNQVIIIAKPQRTGLQAYDIPVNMLKPENTKENILFQLVTTEGDEIDYSLINYIQPDKK